MYDVRVACCPLVSYGEYADWQTDRRTDGRQTVTITLLTARLWDYVHEAETDTNTRCSPNWT